MNDALRGTSLHGLPSGTLTQKYQARFTAGSEPVEMASASDTDFVHSVFGGACPPDTLPGSPVDTPSGASFLPFTELARRLGRMIGATFADAGHDQERNRGAGLHRAICRFIGYSGYQDNGTFPDITAQLVEVKLQTSPTIDLGLVTPDSTDALDLPDVAGKRFLHCDVRYAVFRGETDGSTVTLRQLVLVTGRDFFSRFPRFGGKVLNKKFRFRYLETSSTVSPNAAATSASSSIMRPVQSEWSSL